MKTKQILLVLIVLIGIGMFAIPSTVSLFAGQHSFVNIDAAGNQINCVKCHSDVQNELTAVGDRPHDEFTCSMCHRIEAGGSSGDNVVFIQNYANGDVKRTMLLSESDIERLPLTIPNVGSIKGKDVDGVTPITKILTKQGDSNWLAATVSPSTDPLFVGDLTESGEVTRVDTVKAGVYLDTNTTTQKSGVRISDISVRNGKKSTYVNWIMNGTKQPVVNYTGFGSEVVNPGYGEYHAASLVSCMACHAGEPPEGHEAGELSTCKNCHYGGGAAIDGQAGQQMRALEAGGLDGEKEAHTEFLTTVDGITVQQDGYSNGACVACHTMTAVDITYTKPTDYGMSVDMTGGATETLTAFAANGELETTSGIP